MMNPLMNCMICQDKRRFQMVLNDAERILMYITRYDSFIPSDFTLTPEEEDHKRRIYYYNSVHMMCGYCHEVNPHQLRHLEDQIMDKSYICYALIKRGDLETHDKEHLTQAFRELLRGFYPNIAQLFFQLHPNH